jgi:hypothetical protein
MFAPVPDRAAAELFRVARPGGVIGMANYGSVGFLRAMADVLTRVGPEDYQPICFATSRPAR